MAKQEIKIILLGIFVLAFFGLAGSASAATYYVDATAGNDSWTGTSGAFTSGTAGPWKTVGKVNSFNFQAGDDVYFKCGETWQEQLIVDWNGTGESNHAVIGAYYLSGSTPIIGVNGNKPLILGRWGTVCNMSTPNPNSLPSTDYDALIRISQQSHVTVQDLGVKDSGGVGIGAGGSWDNRQSGNSIRILRCDVRNSFGIGIGLVWTNSLSQPGIQGGLGLSSVEDCVVDGANRGEETYCQGQPSGNCITANLSRNVTIRGNTAINCWGEGIGNYNNANETGLDLGYCTIEKNILYNVNRTPIYIAGSHNTIVRYNLVYGTNDPTFAKHLMPDGRYYQDIGITVAAESNGGASPFGELHDNWVYGNFVANSIAGLCLHAWNKNDPVARNKFYNNTVVGCAHGFYVPGCYGDNCSYDSIALGGGNEVKSNIFWGVTDSVEPNGQWSDYGPYSGISFDYNLWTKQPGWEIARGVHDPSYAAPLISKTTGWNSLTVGSLTLNDFKLQSNSPAIDKGIALGSPYNSDYFGTTRPQPAQGGWDIGAHEYAASGGDTTAPASPNGLSVR